MNALLIKLLADAAVLPIIFGGAYGLLFRVPKNHRYVAYCRVLMAGLTSYALAKLIGSVYQPESERPFELLGQQAGASFLNNPGFPSDHVLFCTAIVLAVWFETRSKVLTGVLAFFTILVAVGRVLALVHTPLDVIGGIVIGALGAVWYLQRPTATHSSRTK